MSTQVANHCVKKGINIPFISGGGPGVMMAWLEPADALGTRCYGIATPNVPEFAGS
ncbi:hypothetical protein FACS1894166_13480 [Bacilli bacterium]|nr:hypothetical protein FACS1894166_13480 [Bacilli bacterium]